MIGTDIVQNRQQRATLFVTKAQMSVNCLQLKGWEGRRQSMGRGLFYYDSESLNPLVGKSELQFISNLG